MRNVSRKDETEDERRRRLDKKAARQKEYRAKRSLNESPEERSARLKTESEQKAAKRATAALAESFDDKKLRLAEEARRRSEQRSKIPIEFKDHIKNSDVNLKLAAALHKPFRGIPSLATTIYIFQYCLFLFPLLSYSFALRFR